MSVYLVRNKYTVPGFLYWAVTSWVIALTFMTVVGLGAWAYDFTAHVNALKELPPLIFSMLGFCGAYTAMGSICLYMTMWIYWIAVERSSVLVRIGWLLALLLGLHYGALIYAFVASRGMVRVEDSGVWFMAARG